MKYVAVRDIHNKGWMKYSHNKITLFFISNTVHRIHIDTDCMKFNYLFLYALMFDIRIPASIPLRNMNSYHRIR